MTGKAWVWSHPPRRRAHLPQKATAVGPKWKDGRYRARVRGVGAADAKIPDGIAFARRDRSGSGMGTQRQCNAMQCNSKWRYWGGNGWIERDLCGLIDWGVSHSNKLRRKGRTQEVGSPPPGGQLHSALEKQWLQMMTIGPFLQLIRLIRNRTKHGRSRSS